MTSALPLFRIDGKIAFVTGAATGRGASITAGLAQQDDEVVLSDNFGVNLSGTRMLVARHRRALASTTEVRGSRQVDEGERS
jgi:NAD(P)-dependent dehydrogenase (short-subunit alcohol dehydrogenase family)